MGISPFPVPVRARPSAREEAEAEVDDADMDMFNDIGSDGGDGGDGADGNSAIRIGSGEGHAMSEWQELAMPTDNKWTAIHTYAKGIWPTPMIPEHRTTAKIHVLKTILSPDFIWMTKWYQNLPDDLSDPQVLKIALDIVKLKIEAMEVRMFKDEEYRRQGYTALRSWVEYCNRKRDGNYAIDDIIVFRDFMDERVEHFRNNPKADAAKKGVIRESAMRDSMRKTVTMLGRMANWQGYFNQLAREETVAVLTQKLIQDRNKAREKPQDYGKTSRWYTTRFTKEEKERRQNVLWKGSAFTDRVRKAEAELAIVRAFGMITLNSVIGRRGMDICQIRFAMLLCHTLEHVKPVQCDVVGAGIRRVKEESGNEEHLLGWCRANNRMFCGVGALAMVVVWRLDLFRYGKSAPAESVNGGSVLFNLMRRDLKNRKAWLAKNPAKRGPEPVAE